jgi:hypothetical protein
MLAAFNRDNGKWKRGVAAFAAALLLLAQSLGSAHFHPLPSQQNYAASTAGSGDNGLCAVCLVRAHSPTVFFSTPLLTAPVLYADAAEYPAESRIRSAFNSHRFGRAPPASL